jgi:hypothetical protein
VLELVSACASAYRAAQVRTRLAKRKSRQSTRNVTPPRRPGLLERLVTESRWDEVSLTREMIAAARVRNAQIRDEIAVAREAAVEARKRLAVEDDDPSGAVAALRALRISDASLRQWAALERIAAATDREAAAAYRDRAAADRSSRARPS